MIITRASVELADDATLYESLMLFHWIFIINLYGSMSVCLVCGGLRPLAADEHGSASDPCPVGAKHFSSHTPLFGLCYLSALNTVCLSIA